MSKELTSEEELRKKAIFDAMSPRRQKHIKKKGYDQWDPFIEPKDPIEIRKDKTKRTSRMLFNEFFHANPVENYSNEYGRGVLEICMGMVNEEERFRGMYDFVCWYRELLKREGFDQE